MRLVVKLGTSVVADDAGELRADVSPRCATTSPRCTAAATRS